ncbi:unnamed protein product, partial [Tetraodon nigroviridis]
MEVEDKDSDLEQAVVITEMVKKWAVKQLEEEEVDELEDEIKRVFLKGLLPEDEEVGAPQESKDEVTGSSLFDDDLRKTMYQRETEGPREVEDRTDSLDPDRTTPAVEYQEVEQTNKKTVRIVETPEMMFEVVSTQRGTRPVSAPVFSQAALAEAGIPFDQPQTSTPIKTTRKEERKLEVTVEAVEPSKIESVADIKVVITVFHVSLPTLFCSLRFSQKRKKIEADSIYIRHSLLMLEDFDKPNEDLVKHHASISELKRNFMEAVPESRPSEWDKRLSTHSPFRSLGINGQPLPGADGSSTVSHQNQPGGVKVHHARAPVAEESREEVVVSRTSLVPVVEVERAQLPPSPHPGCRALDEAQMNGGPCPEVSEGSGRIIGPSSAAYFRSDGPQVIRCFQPPLVQTQRVTITAESNSLPSGTTTTTTTTTTDVPVVPTQTIIYESSKEPDEGTEKDSMTVSSSTSITSETTSGTTVTTTTTHISKVVKSGSTETRMEKRIVITADSDADQDKV